MTRCACNALVAFWRGYALGVFCASAVFIAVFWSVR